MNIFKIEFKRALFNKWTLISFLIGLVICLIPVPQKYLSMKEFYEGAVSAGHNPVIYTGTVFNVWLLHERFERMLYIFIFIMPLLATFPFGGSYYQDKKNGYIKNIVSRCNMKTYTVAKYSATFLSGGMVVTTPLIIQFMILSLIYPVYKPTRFATTMVGETTFAIDLFFEHPMLNTMMWCLVVFIVAGLMATISLCTSKYVYNYFGIILTPFVFSFFLIFLTYITGKSELAFLYTISSWADCSFNYGVMFIEIIIMFIATFLSFVFTKKEVL